MTIYLVVGGSVADCKFLIRNLYPANKSTEKMTSSLPSTNFRSATSL